MNRVATPLMGLFIIAVFGYFAYAFWGPTRTIGVRASVRQDDFVYSVIGVRRAAELGPPGTQVASGCHATASAPAVAGCLFWVVSVNVENKAKRAPYVWNSAIVYLQYESGGNRLSHDPDGQRAFDAQAGEDHVLPPGVARTFGVVFRVGGAQQRMLLGYSNGMLMGDLLDGMAYSRVRVLLEPPRALRARVAP